MAEQNGIVSLYQTSSLMFNQLIEDSTIDENGIYFVYSEDGLTPNKIYVGSVEYSGSGSGGGSITSESRTYTYTGTFTQAITFIVEDIDDNAQIHVISTFINGLRSTSECITTIDESIITVSPNSTYSEDTELDIVVDVIILTPSSGGGEIDWIDLD